MGAALAAMTGAGPAANGAAAINGAALAYITHFECKFFVFCHKIYAVCTLTIGALMNGAATGAFATIGDEYANALPATSGWLMYCEL